MLEIADCRKTFPNHYIRVTASDNNLNRETPRLSFIVDRPKEEPGFMIERHEVNGRSLRYATRAHANDRLEAECVHPPDRTHKEVLKKATGSVLFIGEAYYLYKAGSPAQQSGGHSGRLQG